ncbi:hypothetical protein IV203_037006 [Nitzschia inconspicua]|uniref:Uncharacterized protein n=1 Tax=Nitzschia inconspicua TaxID=303405 RepID=A0A9K3K723_9STRA|nr:hypothetical protein IV203_037006 [Nitzschia inconspicua]
MKFSSDILLVLVAFATGGSSHPFGSLRGGTSDGGMIIDSPPNRELEELCGGSTDLLFEGPTIVEVEGGKLKYTYTFTDCRVHGRENPGVSHWSFIVGGGCKIEDFECDSRATEDSGSGNNDPCLVGLDQELDDKYGKCNMIDDDPTSGTLSFTVSSVPTDQQRTGTVTLMAKGGTKCLLIKELEGPDCSEQSCCDDFVTFKCATFVYYCPGVTQFCNLNNKEPFELSDEECEAMKTLELGQPCNSGNNLSNLVNNGLSYKACEDGRKLDKDGCDTCQLNAITDQGRSGRSV